MLIDWSSEKKTDVIKEKILRSSDDLFRSIPWSSWCVHHTHATEITELMVEVTQMFLHIYIAKMTQNTAHKMKQVEI